LGGVSLSQIEEVKKSNEKLSKDDVLRKFSDKRVKKTSSLVKKIKKEPKVRGERKKSAFGNSLYRYYVPLLFLSAEGKTVIRKCRVLNVKDDKKYDTLSKNGWEV
jgi:murein L,D-transpeptidase YafK